MLYIVNGGWNCSNVCSLAVNGPGATRLKINPLAFTAFSYIKWSISFELKEDVNSSPTVLQSVKCFIEISVIRSCLAVLLRGQKQRWRSAFPTVTHEEQTPVSSGCSSAWQEPLSEELEDKCVWMCKGVDRLCLTKSGRLPELNANCMPFLNWKPRINLIFSHQSLQNGSTLHCALA